MISLKLVDSSICVDYLRKTLSPALTADFNALLLDGNLAINKVIWAELYHGIKGKREQAAFDKLISLSIELDFDERCWNEIAQVGRRCHALGVNVPFSDLMIQACADRYGVELLHNDKHFDFIQGTQS